MRDGWLWTGDLARRDDDGFYYLEGRRAARINVGGFKIAPEEVEALAELGVATATLPLKVLLQLPESEATSAAAATFLEDAKAIQ